MEGLHDLQFYDYVRLSSALISVCGAWRLAHQVNARQRFYTRRSAEWAWVIAMTLFAIFTATIEAVIRDTPYRYSTFLFFLIAVASWHAARSDKSVGQEQDD